MLTVSKALFMEVPLRQLVGWFHLSLVLQIALELVWQRKVGKKVKSVTADAASDAMTTQLGQQSWSGCEKESVKVVEMWMTLKAKLEGALYLHRAVKIPLLGCWVEPHPPASETLCSWR